MLSQIMSGPVHPTRDALLRVARTLPAAPQVMLSICELLQDINTDLDQIAAEIRMDAALAARVVRVSNSVVYGGGGSISSVEEAVSRVGFSEIVRLVGTAAAAGIVDRELRCYHIAADVLRESVLLHALASEALADSAGIDASSAYIAGLLRGIGMMVLDRFARDRLEPAHTYDPTAFATYREWENERFGLTAIQVTTMAMDDWRFPEEVVAAIELHCQPIPGDREANRIAHILNLAGSIATDHGTALPGEVMHWIRTPEKLAAAGLDEEKFALAKGRATTLFEQQRHALY
jgi:HD-like signal output (HDOD) protein